MQGLFKNTSGQFFRLFLFSCISVALLYIDYNDDRLRGFRSTLGTTIVEPIKFVATLPSATIKAATSVSVSRKVLQTHNTQLSEDNYKLKAELLQLQGLEAENQRLRELLNSTESFNTQYTVAEIVSIDLDPFKQLITLNKGSNDKINPSQAILDAYGVMGQVIKTTNNTATTLLISDPGHSLPVQIKRNGLRTLANGTGHADELALMHIPTNADVQAGDIIITSGLGGIFPKNYPVGTVINVIREPGQHFLQVTAKPTAQLNRSREVLVLQQVTRDVNE